MSLEYGDGVKLQSFNFSDVLGRTITCEDGVARRVEQISYSHRFADKVLINEINEDENPGGAWVHVLSLNCQMFGNPVPTPAQKAHFSRIFRGIKFVPNQETADGFVELPSGIIVKQG